VQLTRKPRSRRRPKKVSIISGIRQPPPFSLPSPFTHPRIIGYQILSPVHLYSLSKLQIVLSFQEVYAPKPKTVAKMSATPAPATPNPTATPPNPDSSRKRARPTKSCLECRRKKLKCDRVQPCLQCKKLGREALCTYTHGPSGPQDLVNENMERSQKRLRVDVLRPNSWGGVMNSNLPAGSYAGVAVPMDIRKVTEQGPVYRGGGQSMTSGRLHVKGSRSRYIGLGENMALFDHVGVIPLLNRVH
jgi:hypothetical protein